MADSRFAELREAVERSDKSFEHYERDCQEFIRALRARLVSHLHAPDESVEWVSYADTDEMLEERGYVDATVDRRMILYDDAYYQFAFKLLVDSSFVVIHLKVKRQEDGFVVRVGKDDFKVSSPGVDAIDPFIAQLYETLIDHFEGRFDEFMRGEPRDLGFVTP